MQVIAHRMAAVEDRQDRTEEILGAVSDSLRQLVLIENNQRTMTADMAIIKDAINGDNNTQGLLSRMASAETKIAHHKLILIYVGTSLGTGIAGGIAYITATIWKAAMKAAGGP